VCCTCPHFLGDATVQEVSQPVGPLCGNQTEQVVPSGTDASVLTAGCVALLMRFILAYGNNITVHSEWHELREKVRGTQRQRISYLIH
jgi:hypothetical protein